jgi:crotonobetainyl-CoA:carnitine CoA-transferase CaiB-like acyl-CoA transferase
MTSPMAGIRILEVAEHTFVPAASAILADWGADVIKIEHAQRGDAMRGLASTGVMALGGGDVHALLEHSNRGKRSLGLDLAEPEGREILYRLAEKCDVFLTNKLPHVLRNLQIDVADIKARNPRIVYVRGTGFGSLGPDADKGGYDVLGYWCRSGLAVGAQPLEVDRLVMQPSPAYGDSIGAMTIAGGISAALLHRERTGDASVIDVSLLATGMWAMGAGIAVSQQLGTPCRQPPASLEEIRNPIARGYQSADGRWLFLSCLQAFHYWPEVCRVADRPDLVGDPRFDSHENLTANAPEAAKILESEFGTRPMAHWTERFADFKGQWALVQDSVEVANDPQVVANGYLVKAKTKAGTEFSLVATPVQFDGLPSQPTRAPEFNEHGDEILSELLHLDDDELIDLKLKNVVA